MIQINNKQEIYTLTLEPEDHLPEVKCNGKAHRGEVLLPTTITITYHTLQVIPGEPESVARKVAVFGPVIKKNGDIGLQMLHAKWSTLSDMDGGGQPYDRRPEWVRDLEARVTGGVLV